MKTDNRKTGSDLDRILQDAYFGFVNNDRGLRETDRVFLEEYCLDYETFPKRDDISSKLLADKEKSNERTIRNGGVLGAPDVLDCPPELISPPNSNQ